jgi:prepilin-type N-terminal cleavage/methylation domain-containing protein
MQDHALHRRCLVSVGGFSLLEVLMVVAVVGVIAAVAVPMTGNTIAFFRLSGDSRSISNSIAVVKMRAASDFSQVRLFVDLTTNGFHIEKWQTTGTPGWVAEGGTTTLSSNVVFGFGAVTSAPPNTQATISQAPACLDAAAQPIANTACIVFNSRGIPVDGSGAPTALNALYLTDGTAVYGATVSATGMTRLWRTPPSATPTWTLQ